jgi:hypothetical protein
VSSCLDRGPEALLGNTAPDPLERQVWTLILADDAGKVWIAQTDSAVAVHGESPAAATAALWSVLDSAPDFRDLRLTAQVDGRQMSWTLMRAGVPLGSGLGAMRAYVGSAGAPRFSGTASLELDGTRRSASFDAIGGLPMPAEPVVQAPRAAPPPAHGIVSLRADDCPATESQVLAFLRAAGLTAEFAVPTRLVGRPGRCTWATVDSLAAAGNAIEAHSRFHERSPATFGDFYIETIGSALDLVSRGHPAHLFIQPGSWLSGPPDLDDPSKLLTPYAALLRRTFVGIEGYAVSGTSLSYIQSGTGGPPVYYLKDFDEPTLRALLDDLTAQPRWIQFFWHTGDQPLDRLARQLQLIAEYRDRGALDVMPLYQAVQAGETGTRLP